MIYYPYWAQLNFLAACVVTAWILVPIGFINGIWGSDKYPIQTQTLYLRNGSTVRLVGLRSKSWPLILLGSTRHASS